MLLLFFVFFVSSTQALCPCPGTECTSFVDVQTCYAEYYARGLYNVRVKMQTTNAANVTVRTMPGDHSAPCNTVGTYYSDLSYPIPIDCYESLTFLLNTCSTNGFTFVLEGTAPTNYIVTLTPIADCPTPSPTAAPTVSPTSLPTPSPTASTTTTTTTTTTESNNARGSPVGQSGSDTAVIITAAIAAPCFLIVCTAYACWSLRHRRRKDYEREQIEQAIKDCDQFDKIVDTMVGEDKRNQRRSRSGSRRRSANYKRRSGNSIELSDTVVGLEDISVSDDDGEASMRVHYVHTELE